MHIRRLELQGFKSFKDKTVIHFDDGITGIVGPNGCGKSNVVDAFFWVMGEQNARHLRGQSMDDLIFAGADKAPPASYAEVTLTLDMPGEVSGPAAAAGASSNELITLPTREVAITRKLYRTGESDYFINKTPCRLRDIQELFMDTGVGSRGYSIIQQGQIAKIVQAKPEDRRTMIEEVAGIVKYKTRRKESMRKLEGTQQNLLRVSDVINELETQKRQMERQADKARKFKEYKTRLQDIELRFNALRWEDLSNKLGTLELDLETLTVEDLALTTARESAETQISQKRMELAQASNVAEEFQKTWIQAGNALNNAENDLKYSHKNLEDLTSSFAQLEKDTEEERILVESLRAENEKLSVEAETIDEQFALADQGKKDRENETLDLKRSTEELEKRTEELRRKAYQIGSVLEKTRSSAHIAAVRLAEISENIARMKTDKEERQLFLAGAQAEQEAAQARLAEVRELASFTSDAIGVIAAEISDLNRTLQETRKEQSNVSSEQAKIRTTLKTLEDQKLRHEGSSKGVRAIFQDFLPKKSEMQSTVLGTLANLIEVQKGREVAVESILGRSLDLVITNNSDHQMLLANELKSAAQGRASFADIAKLAAAAKDGVLPFSAPAELSGEVLGNLAESIQLTSEADPKVKELLAVLLKNTILVQSADTAAKLAEKFTAHSFVTIEGEIFRSGWYLEGGDKSSVSGAYVARNREISDLQAKLAELTEKLALVEEKLLATEATIRDKEFERKNLEESLKLKQADVQSASSAEAALSARTQEAERSLKKILEEENRYQADQARLEREEKESNEKAVELETEKLVAEEELQNLAAELSEAREQLEVAQSSLVEARVKAANVGDQKNTLQTRLRQSQNALDQHRNRIDHMIETAKRKQQESESTTEKISILEIQIEELRNTWIDSEQTYRVAKERFDILNNEVEEQRSAAQLHATRERGIKESLMSKRLDFQKFTSDRDLLAQNTFEHYGLTLGEYALMPETQEQIQLLRDSGEEFINEIKNEVTLLREKVRKLGDVNPAAVEEYDAIVDRYNMLASQKADLERAMNDLQSTVDRINTVSQERFARAFEEVNVHFKRVFPVIFGGGHAHLTLTNPEDMLETGVDITAQPPGKKPQNINLLSGGEKTLTAISLLFSIFLVKPSPFCLLDEVDAPLDDANIGRFNALLREMSKRSQFIIITHNKRTMELNDKLYGVTMEDAGVSKMVSIMLSANA